MNILLSGCKGFMGKELIALAEKGVKNARVTAGVDINACGDESMPCFNSFSAVGGVFDCIVDFSHHSATHELIEFAVKNELPLVIATTGQTEEEKEEIRLAAKKIPLFFASNYSLGIALLTESAKKIAAAMPDADIEIVEYHHNRKADAPSGTALTIFEEIKQVRTDAWANTRRADSGKRQPEEIGIHSVRMGNICGIHEVIIGNSTQTITLKHEAHNRAVFAEGALAAAEFLASKPVGFYGIKDML